MPQYEYKFELSLGSRPNKKSDAGAVEAELNALGSEGWELVAVSPTGKENSWTGYWFKREKAKH
jgi:hypothetical protein